MSTESTPPKAKSSVPTSEELSWLAHAQKEKQSEPARLEDTAKFLVAIISICLTIFITKPPVALAPWASNLMVFVAFIWLVAILSCFFVFYPREYTYYQESPDSIKQAYKEITRTKRWYLRFSLFAFLIGLAGAVGIFIWGTFL